MATCRDIITAALRKAGQLAPSEAADHQELEAGRALLAALYAGWVAGGMFGPLHDVIAEVDAAAGENQRILARAGVTITLASSILDDGASEARPPRNRSVVMIARANDTTELHIYSGAAGEWRRADRLPSNDAEAPLSDMGSDGLAACLAEAMSSESSQPVNAATARSASLFRMALAGGFDSARGPVRADYF